MASLIQSSFWQSLNPFSSTSVMLADKIIHMRKVREMASLEELKQQYANICAVNAKLSFREQQKFGSHIKMLQETMENYLVVHQRMEGLLQDLGGENLKELQEKYEQLHLCLRQLPRDTQKQYYGHLVQIRDRLERGL